MRGIIFLYHFGGYVMLETIIICDEPLATEQPVSPHHYLEWQENLRTIQNWNAN